MFAIFGLIIMTKECVIEPKAQRDRRERERDCQQRQQTQLARGQLPRIQRNQKESKGAADGAPNAKAERVFERFFYRAVDRDQLLLMSRFVCVDSACDNSLRWRSLPGHSRR